MSGKYDGYQTYTDVEKDLYSMEELGNSYEYSGELEFLYLQGGVKDCERIETSLSIDMAVIGTSHLQVS